MNKEKKFTKVQELIYELRVADAMVKDVIIAKPQTLMSELRELLRFHRISGVPVMDGDKIAGIISIEDFIKWLAEGKEDCPIKDRMTKVVKTLYADEPLIHGVRSLEQSGFGRYPVVSRENGRLVGIITKGSLIEALLRKLEIDYHEAEIRRYRAAHIFEDIIGQKTSLIFQCHVQGKDFDRAGEASSRVRKILERLGIHPDIVRRVAIASYEAEMNLVIYTEGGEITVRVYSDKIQVEIVDSGPGIPDIRKALEPGYSTAPDWVRELGFGAGMGLNNIQRCSDDMRLESAVNKGTHLSVRIDMKNS